MALPPTTASRSVHEIGVADQRNAQLASLVTLALLGLGLVADDERGFGVDGVGVRQAGVHDPLDEFLMGAVDLGGHGDPHALHQRAARDESAGVDEFGQGSRAASIFSGRNSSCVTWPLGHSRRDSGRTGSHTLRSRARTSTGLRICASTIASSSASWGLSCVIPQCAARVSSRRFSVPNSSLRVSSTVHIAVSMGSSASTNLGLGGQERVVEAHVVRHQGAAAQAVRSDRRRCRRSGAGPPASRRSTRGRGSVRGRLRD